MERLEPYLQLQIVTIWLYFHSIVVQLQGFDSEEAKQISEYICNTIKNALNHK